jgi:response regulator RpfG family c-di-GMP phosphodiesterase
MHARSARQFTAAVPAYVGILAVRRPNIRCARRGAVAAALHEGGRAWQCYRRAVASAIKVLVIDDDPGIRQMLGLALREARFEVVLSDGQLLDDAGAADVILLDVRLGNRSARELLAEVPSLADVPIIVMTAVVDIEAAARELSGIAAVVGKPFDLDVLESTIRDVVARSPRPA